MHCGPMIPAPWTPPPCQWTGPSSPYAPPGRTSVLAADALRARGYTAYSLSGGMGAWSGAWNTAEVPCGDSSLQIVQVRRTGKGCLSYVVSVGGTAAVIDPSVDPTVYLGIAESRGWRIVSVLETHVHADHLSRALPLCRISGAVLSMPEQRRVSFPYEPLRDGQGVSLGERAGLFTALRTPGHTEESTCYVVPGRVVFTGDTLFLQSVGRPDLEGGMGKAEALSRALFRSLAALKSLPGSFSCCLPIRLRRWDSTGFPSAPHSTWSAARIPFSLSPRRISWQPYSPGFRQRPRITTPLSG